MATALGDLRVLDFSRVLAGPVRDDAARPTSAPTVDQGRAPGHRRRHPRAGARPTTTAARRRTSSRSTATRTASSLDLRRRAATSRRPARSPRDADVVVENFRPGVMDELGLGYDELRAEPTPGSSTARSPASAAAPAPRCPATTCSSRRVGGLMSITGEPDGEPQKVGVALVDVLAGLFATVGILAALRHRDATGEGQRVEVDLLVLAARRRSSTRARPTRPAGVVPERMGNQHPSIAPYELLRCADGDLVLAVGNDRQFAALCEVLGAPELADDARFATNPDARRAPRARCARRSRSASPRGPAADWAAALTRRARPGRRRSTTSPRPSRSPTELGLEPVVALPREDGIVRRPDRATRSGCPRRRRSTARRRRACRSTRRPGEGAASG